MNHEKYRIYVSICYCYFCFHGTGKNIYIHMYKCKGWCIWMDGFLNSTLHSQGYLSCSLSYLSNLLNSLFAFQSFFKWSWRFFFTLQNPKPQLNEGGSFIFILHPNACIQSVVFGLHYCGKLLKCHYKSSPPHPPFFYIATIMGYIH